MGYTGHKYFDIDLIYSYLRRRVFSSIWKLRRALLFKGGLRPCTVGGVTPVPDLTDEHEQRILYGPHNIAGN